MNPRCLDINQPGGLGVCFAAFMATGIGGICAIGLKGGQKKPCMKTVIAEGRARRLSSDWGIPLVLLLCLGILYQPNAYAEAASDTVAADSSAVKNSYQPASILALPELQCKLYPTGGDPASEGVPVYTDDDGYARFYAVRATTSGAVRSLILDCTDPAGKPSRYSVDLTAENTFAPRPVNLAKERGTDRPALQDDPLSYTQSELIESGYGLRPDPGDTAAYARWLASATKSGRMLEAKRPSLHDYTVTSSQAPAWVGSVLTGKPNYISTDANFNVPTAHPGGDQTTKTEIAIWNGLGGFGTGSGLIQGGVNLYTTPTAASYGSWREYCCGNADSNGYGGAFVPKPGDEIFSQEWYCDAKGNLNLNGGYGCTYLHDLTSGAILSCTLAAGKPCWSVKALPLCSASPKTANCMTIGRAAEFVIENQSPQVSSTSTAFTDFTPQVTMTGSAYSSQTNKYSQTVNNDSTVSLLTDFTKTTTHIVVTLGSAAQTNFSIEPGETSYPLYCQGRLITSTAPTPLTPFKWSSRSAHAVAPGPGQCAWADRVPQGAEINKSGGNLISGYLNQVANLPAGKYAEIGVYRDTNADNDLVVTKIVGIVKPPFSSSTTLP